jgi:hypothetical protein
LHRRATYSNATRLNADVIELPIGRLLFADGVEPITPVTIEALERLEKVQAIKVWNVHHNYHRAHTAVGNQPPPHASQQASPTS